MKICLISPPYNSAVKSVVGVSSPPLGLAYIASMLRQDHEVKIIDSNILNYTIEDVEKELRSFLVKFKSLSVFQLKCGGIMRIHVRFFTGLREITGKTEETLEFPEEVVSLNLVIEKLAERYGENFIKYVYEPETGKIRDFLQFLLNGRSILAPNSLDTRISDGDVIVILPTIDGG